MNPTDSSALMKASLQSQSSPIFPVRVLDIELGNPLPALPAVDTATGQIYPRAQALVRLHSYPLGVVDLPLSGAGLEPADVAAAIWRDLRPAINTHLQQDGLPAASGLDKQGLPVDGLPACGQARQRFLATAPFASIVVATRDRAASLARCLPSLLDLDYPHYEIIIVDNAPRTTATADLIRESYGHLDFVRYVREDCPGLSRARNCGLRHAQGEIVAYIDDDEPADRYWLAELAMAFRATERVTCVTGLTLAAELETEAQVWLEQFGGFYKGRGFEPQAFNMTTHRLQHPLYPYLASLFGCGGNMAFRTSTLRSLGGFDVALGAGTVAGAAEELDLFFQTIMHGDTLVYTPSALVRHFHRRENPGLQRQLHNYGRAFTAYLTKSLLADPRRLLYLLGKLPVALQYLFSPTSPRNEHKAASYPPELTRSELLGMLYGPLAYLRSRWQARNLPTGLADS